MPKEKLHDDDAVLATIRSTINSGESLAFLLAGPPGTGKTHYARRLANALAEGEEEQILFLQFHPAIGYDDFIEGFRPEQAKEGNGIVYSLAPRLFLNFAEKARQASEKHFVIVIDELNRGDIARVFGEVLTYLEVDYREKEFTLPFSGKSTVIPKNLILVATANPYDRSVTDLDDALLRRFWVIDFEPSETALKQHLQSHKLPKGLVNRTLHMFNTLNQEFPHGFGHTNFLKVRNLEDLSAIWLGRVHLALRRALIHDTARYDKVVSQIEELLSVTNDEDERNGDNEQQ